MCTNGIKNSFKGNFTYFPIALFPLIGGLNEVKKAIEVVTLYYDIVIKTLFLIWNQVYLA